jgi:hypothetical protein
VDSVRRERAVLWSGGKFWNTTHHHKSLQNRMTEDLTSYIPSDQGSFPSCLFSHCTFKKVNSQISTSGCLVFLATHTHLGQSAWLCTQTVYVYL